MTRRAVVGEPRRLLVAPSLDALAVGGAAGLVMVELPAVLENLFDGVPGGTATAYLVAGWLVGLGVTGVVGITAWRAALGTGRAAALRRTVGAGAWLGAGLVLGSQVAPRSSAVWQSVFPTADDRAFSPALGRVSPATTVWLVVVALLVGTFATAWAAGSGAAWADHLGRRRGTTVIMVLVGASVLCVPLGGWFLLLRLAASGATGPSPSVGSSFLLAAVSLAVVSTARARLRATLFVGAFGALLLLATLLPGTEPGPGFADPPPGVRFPASRQAGLACLWIHNAGSVGTGSDADYQRRLGGYLSSTDDPLTRAIGDRLSATAGNGDPESGRSARAALVRRCDAYRASGR